ncbi:toxin secretion/phage lysis holin [Caloramator quimbayensis]|uniref:Toxin secretion/phage lysis holin n=1 Tax=Caloramator quimbayensis TaxID=1147123 RepID=A0A1T4WS42_9CLOT|nr:phage holin family protein [Caloramator quimbayensis]SKA80089.1 toxin secretion/phage lysis holin [Caloramator quimbayensis]
MDYISKVFEMWQIKLIVGSFIMIFSPFKVSIIVLFILIIIDTITACSYAIKIRKFTSRRFQRAVKKIAVYFTTVFVVRLLEIGIETIIQTNMVTRLILSFLILTEAISILENLTLLGLPIPPKILKLILGSLNLNKFNGLFGKDFDKQFYAKEIDDIIQYQLNYINAEEIRKLLKIELEEFKNALSLIEIQTTNYNSENKDLLFYRISSLIDATKKALIDKWNDEYIEEDIMSKYAACHEKRFERLIEDIRVICYSNEKIEKKNNMIADAVMAFIYKMIADIQKDELICKKSD